MKQQYAFELGAQAESYFQELCRKNNIPFIPVNTWYDYDIYDLKVEVKSCQLVVKNNPTRYKTGRWDFTNKNQRIQLKEANAWICLLVAHQDQYLTYGFMEANKLPNDRYISIPKARTLETITLEEWKERIEVPF